MLSAQSTLADVTSILANLLEVNVGRLTGSAPTVTFMPPEQSDSVAGTHLNLYLYLAAHDGDGGPNLPFASGNPNPIENVPLPLKLYYVVTPHVQDSQDIDTDILGQQTLMGFAMKTFHDHPLIRDDTQIGPTPVVPAGASLGGGRIEISLRPVTPEESVNFWSADQVRTARLAAYYEVRTVLIPPEEPTSAGGPVADVALGVFAGGPPRLFSSTSTQEFTQAAALGGAMMSIERAPAVAMMRAAPGPDAVVTVSGLAMGDGSDAAILLRGETLPGGSVTIEAGANPAWAISVADQTLSFTVNPTVQPRAGGPIDLVPGLYTVALVRQRTLTNEDGSVQRTVEVESNRLPFAIAPTIDSANVIGGFVTIVTHGGYDATAPAAQADLAVGLERYLQVDDGGASASPVDGGTFSEPNATTYEALPVPALASGTYPVRLTVNGAESQPVWMEVP